MSRSTSFVIAVVVLLADQLTKLVVRARVDVFDTVVLIPGCLNIIRSANRGIAFGILSDSSSPWTRPLLISIAVAVIAVIGRLLWSAADASSAVPGGAANAASDSAPGPVPNPAPDAAPGGARTVLALALILGGAAGNLLDRIVHGEVTDFIDLYIGRFHWYTFNVADAAITVAAALLLMDIFFPRGRVVNE